MNPVRKEIGSEFWSVPTAREENRYFPQDTRWFLSGRSALACMIADIRRSQPLASVAMPAWCCDSMVRPFADAGIAVRFYPVYRENGRLVQELSAAEGCDALFLMDYFGYAGNSDASGFDGIRIRDLTHSVFSGQYSDARYYFGSLRKWAGFRTGGFGWGFSCQALPENEAYISLRRSAMEQKARYIAGSSGSKEYLSVFNEAEELLEHCAPAAAQAEDVQLAAKLDIAGMKRRRRENAARLLEAFADIAIFPEMGPRDCPLFVPVAVPGGRRDALRRYLIQNEIYCPVHWPLTRYHAPDGRSAALYAEELSLVCDQRYTPEDMDRLIETVKRFWKD